MRTLTLVVPGLLERPRARALAMEPGALPPLRGLETFLARARRCESERRGDLAGILAHALAAQLDPAGVPIATAPLRRLGDAGEPDDGWWLCLDPVHLLPATDHLRLVPASHLQIRHDEARALAAGLARAFEPDGFILEVPHPERWYLRCPGPLECSTLDPKRVAGRNVYAFMPSGPAGAFLRRLQTEAQMLLHEHPVNQARERAGRAPVNSIWPWGGGALARVRRAATEWPVAWSDDVLVRGLWRQAEAPWHALPATLEHCLDDAAHGVVVIDTVSATLAGGEADWADALRQLEANWFLPLQHVLRSGQLGVVRLLTGTGFDLEAGRATLRRFWRRRHPFSEYLRGAPDTPDSFV